MNTRDALNKTVGIQYEHPRITIPEDKEIRAAVTYHTDDYEMND